MKKVLLAGTAMGMAAFYAGQAVAQDEASLKLSAFLDTRMSLASAEKNGDQDGTIASNGDLTTNSEIAVTGSKSTDIGTLGIHIELETDEGQTGNVDENSVTIAADWGTVMLGNNDGAEDPKKSGYSFVTDGMQNDMVPGIGSAKTAAGSASTDYYGITSEGGDQTKIMYSTPDMGGLTARVSYTPTITEDAVENATGFGVSYAGGMGAVSVALAAGYSSADWGTGDTGHNADNGTTEGFHFGGTVAMGMFSLGAGYLTSERDDGDATVEQDEENSVWNVGGQVAVNEQLSIAAVYSNAESDVDGTTVVAADEEIEEMSLGVSYKIVDGLSVSGTFLTGEVSEDLSTEEDGEYDGATFQVSVAF